MQQALSRLHDQLAPAEEIFFTWWPRMFGAGILFGTAWIDDAPPLELAAMIVAAYLGVRVATEFGNLVAAAPFASRILGGIFAIVTIIVLWFSFVVIAVFAERLAMLTAA